MEQFVNVAQSLIKAHVRNLKKENQNNIDDGSTRSDDYQRKNKEKERSLFTSQGLLKSGLNSKRVGLQSCKDGEWVHVDVERLLCSSNKMGHTPDCLLSMASEEYSDFYGSAIGALASLCGLWKAGVIREPDDNSIILQYIKNNDAKKLSHWVLDLSKKVIEVAEWLKSEVWEPTGVDQENQIVEISEDYLNLPLWRQRWLLYEIWLVVITINSAISTAWKCTPKLDKSSEVSTWLLSKGKAATECATLFLVYDPSIKLEVWYQGRIKRNGIDMMPDVAIRTPGKDGRDLVIIEGKDRFRMSTLSGKDSALSVGTKYSTASGAHTTWLVNLCSFSGNSLNDPEFNHGSPWQGLYFASEMEPGNIPKQFESSISSSLIPVGHRTFCEAVLTFTQEIIFAIDTTGSMHERLDHIYNRINEICVTSQLNQNFKSYWAVLFGDHDQGHKEPYLFKEIGPFENTAHLIEKIKQMPVTNGGDEPEALEDVILLCRQISERTRNKIIVIIITDASPHTKNECPLKIDFADEVSKLLDGGNYCFVANNFMGEKASSCWLPFQESSYFKWIDLYSDGWLDSSKT